MGDKVYPADTIRYANIDGLVVILDLTTQAYFILNEKATRIWELLLQMEGEVARALRAINEPSLQCQLRSLVKDCLERGFLASYQSAPARRSQPQLLQTKRRFLAPRAWWSLFSTAWALRVNGFSRTYRKYAELPLVAAPDPEELLPAAQNAFLRAENFLWYSRAPEDCLPRSLALFRFLRTMGLPVVHYIGGRRFPAFLMHAWVEHDGLAVLDDPGHVKEYTPLALLPHG